MRPTYSLNTDTLRAAAADAGHVHADGELNLYAISKHAGIDRGSLSRVVRDENGPDLGTLVELATYCGKPIEALIVRRHTPRIRRPRLNKPATATPVEGRAA
jgi:transcriptional regulator with XRE-family HTH domain